MPKSMQQRYQKWVYKYFLYVNIYFRFRWISLGLHLHIDFFTLGLLFCLSIFSMNFLRNFSFLFLHVSMHNDATVLFLVFLFVFYKKNLIQGKTIKFRTENLSRCINLLRVFMHLNCNFFLLQSRVTRKMVFISFT